MSIGRIVISGPSTSTSRFVCWCVKPTLGMFGACAPSRCPCLLWGATPTVPAKSFVLVRG